MIEFASEDSFTILENRRVFTLTCQQDIAVCDLIGQQVKINGEIYICRGVERFVRQLGDPIIKSGERIGILVDIPQNYLAEFAAKLAAAQEPLPADFQKVLNDNLDDLYA